MLQLPMSFEEWRKRARPLLIAGVKPEIAVNAIAEPARAEPPSKAPSQLLKVSAALMRLLESISCHRTAGRYELMYRIAWRALLENPKLLEDAADPDVRSATLMDAAIRRDVHKMHAFVRFREVLDQHNEPAYFAWFEPEHEILHRGSSFFVKRFPNMIWTIATPDGTAIWDKVALSFVDSPARDTQPVSDKHEDLWRTYYRSICNVARINPAAMQREMPQKYWKNLPEAAEIGILIRDGLANFTGRHQESKEQGSTVAKAVQQALANLPVRGEGPQNCRACGLWQKATQAVLGDGARNAPIMLVGEQPGDEEDLRGRPFIGPAGRVLEQAMAEAGLSRSEVYITNAVKHFKWEPRGKRRLHKRPDLQEISACNIWLQKEISDIKPRVIVALGATALRALSGSTVAIESARGQQLTHASGATIVVSYHPSAILRADAGRASDLNAKLVADLKSAGESAFG
jgi:probable DNA metabolism protein